jgi:chromosome segregation ATPase
VEQIAGLELLQQEVEKSLEHIRSESEHLTRTDETLRRQRSILQSTFQELERKQALLQAKGKSFPGTLHVFLSH